MDNSKSLLTINYRLGSAENFVSSIGTDDVYFFVSNSIDANNDVRPFDNEQDTLVNSYYGMIFGKKINTTDSSLMIRRINWQANTIYDIYDHRVEALYDKDFYAIVHEGAQWDVFKCLENGNDNPSTVAPSRTNVGSNNEDFFYPNDGYRWKYMYSIDDAGESKFATSDFFPVKVSANVAADAIPGAIDTILVTSPGRGYNNYFNGTFLLQDLRLNGDPKRYAISTAGVSTVNGYYDNCYLYISSGPGSGQYRLIESYSSNATHNVMFLESEFDSTDLPENSSQFEITPSVKITGDGNQTSVASARAIIDTNANTIARVELIDKGQNYYHATAEVQASPTVGVISQAGVVPILSPVYGHGYDAPRELGCKFAGLSVKLVGSESNTIVTENDYSQIGLLKNPRFRSVEMTLKNQNKDFFTRETVYKIDTKQLIGTGTTNLDANNNPTSTITIGGVNAHQIVRVGSTILLNSSSNYQIANVVSVANGSIVLDQKALWDTGAGTANIHLVTIEGSGLISSFATGSVVLTNATPSFTSSDTLIGATTGVYGQANVVTINTQSKTFSTFVQAFTYIGSMTQGTFTQDELLFQADNPDATARFHSTAPDPVTSTLKIYTTNQTSVFQTSDEIRGTESAAIAALTNKYLPDLVFGSGEVIYIEYGDSITRAAEKTETFKLIFAF
jgi:hypothetical protein